MPIRNTTKAYDSPAYYHIYNRGVAGLPIFHDDVDRTKFLTLFARYLDPDYITHRTDGSTYEKYDADLVGYCLMDNHFHLLVFQETDPEAMTKLMRSVSTAYAMYFNRRHKQSGHLFQSIFKASRITDESYLLHITRYIHMNPRRYLNYKWSSIAYYLGARQPGWMRVDRLNDMSPAQSRDFLKSYEGKKKELELLKTLSRMGYLEVVKTISFRG